MTILTLYWIGYNILHGWHCYKLRKKDAKVLGTPIRRVYTGEYQDEFARNIFSPGVFCINKL